MVTWFAEHVQIISTQTGKLELNNSKAGDAGKTLFIGAGDSSGDLHASQLMIEINRRDPDISFTGYGLDRMLAAGLHHLGETQSSPGSMWLHPLKDIRKFRERLKLARAFFRSRPPRLVILVDYGGFNMFLAREASKAQIPVLYYIIPQVWAHGRYRLKKMRKWVTRAAVIYPFEPDICSSYGLEAEYVGHPLFDYLASHPPRESSTGELREKYADRLIAVFPGSRRQEVRANLPVILDACASVKNDFPELRFAAACPVHLREEVQAITQEHELDLHMSSARPVELARAARLCVTKSGTITLEIASQHTPMLILYRVSALLYFLASGMTHTPYIGIINALAGEMICPEKVMWRCDPGWISSNMRRFLDDEDLYRQCASELKTLMDEISAPGAACRTADMALEMIG